MIKINHYIGGILLVSGTTIGAGMLALPVITGFMGFIPSIITFLIIWAIMLCTSFFFLDVNCSIPGEINLISMAHKTLGVKGKVIAWIFYILLLYSLISAYIAASTPIFTEAIAYITGYTLPRFVSPFALPVLFGGFVYLGTLGVDLINRLLMLGLGISFVILVIFLPSHIEPALLTHFDFKPSILAVPVIITAFGYHIIIPSLTTYMHHDKKHLKWVLFIGSLIPLIIYLLWEFLILGIVPIEGKVGLAEAWQQGYSSTQPLVRIIQNKWIRIGANFFTFFAIVTSFLGVSLSLSDFLTDGFKIKKSWEGRLTACLLTFVPPLIFVITYQRGFIVALEYAGAFVAILLILLPAWMAWHLKKPKFYRKQGGRLLLACIIVFALAIVAIDILEQWGYYKSLIEPYVSISH